MKVRKVRSVLTLPEVLAALGQLGDEELHAVIARAQGLLLDRPAERGETPMLAVEVVVREESHLLAAYRALAPLAQRRVLGYVVRLMRAPRRMGRHRKPSATAAAATTAAPPLTAAPAATSASVGATLASRSRRPVAS